MGNCWSNDDINSGGDSRRPTLITTGKTPDLKYRRKSSHLSDFSSDSKHLFEKEPKIAAFNVRRFGKAKMQDKSVVEILVRIIRRYDVILIQEIVDVSEMAVHELLDKVNDSSSENDAKYELELSPRLGRNQVKEQYGFIYKMPRFKVKKSKVYDDPDDVFIREPFVVQFQSKSIKGADDITLIAVHIQPKSAVKEIDALVEVNNWVRNAFRTKHILILGDLNAGGSYVTNSDWSKIRLRNLKSNFHWLIPDHVDTTATNSIAAYDRIIAYNHTKELVVKASVFRYRIICLIKYDRYIYNCCVFYVNLRTNKGLTRCPKQFKFYLDCFIGRKNIRNILNKKMCKNFNIFEQSQRITV